MRRSMRRSATFGAVALSTLGLARRRRLFAATPAGGTVATTRACRTSSAARCDRRQRVPWATLEQKTGSQQIFVRAFKNGAWKTQGSG